MLRRLYPDTWVHSVYEIDYETLFHQGIRGLIFDIDNTLVPHGAHADARAKALFQRLHDIGFRVMLLSNNKEERVRSFRDEVIYCDYIYKAGKPGRRGYLEAMERMGSDRNSTLFIGDQLFTDVWGANRTGIGTILVDQIDKKEEIQIVFKRKLEAVVLFFYKRSLKSQKNG